MPLSTQSGQSNECGFMIDEYLNHLQQVLQATSQVLVMDIRKGSNKEYIYSAQEDNIVANAVIDKPVQKMGSIQKGEILDTSQGSNNSTVINEDINVENTKQDSPTNENNCHSRSQVQNGITNRIEISNDQPTPANDVKKLNLFPKGVTIKSITDDIFIKRTVIKEHPQICPLGNTATELHHIPCSLDHLQQVLPTTSQVLVDTKNGANKECIYTAQEDNNVVNMIDKTVQKMTYIQMGEILDSIQGSNKSTDINERINVKNTKQDSSTNENNIHGGSLVQNGITSKTEVNNYQPTPANNVEKLKLFPNGAAIKPITDDIIIKRTALIKENPQIHPLGNTATELHHIPCSLDHLQQVLPTTSQVLVEDTKNGANKECIYTAQEANNVANVVISKPDQMASIQMEEILDNIQGSNNSMVINDGMNVENTKQDSLTNENNSHSGSQVQNGITSRTEINNVQPVPDNDVEKLNLFLKPINDDIIIKKTVIKEHPQMGNTMTELHNNSCSQRYTKSNNSQKLLHKSPLGRCSQQSKSPSYKRAKSPRKRCKSRSCRRSKSSRRSRSPSYRISKSSKGQFNSPSCKSSASLGRKCKENEHVKQEDGPRVIYIGRITEGTTKAQLIHRFRKFGTITDITIHFRDHGDNYSFITFQNDDEAYKAIAHGNNDDSLPHYDIRFRGRGASTRTYGRQSRSPSYSRSRSSRRIYEIDYDEKQGWDVYIGRIAESTTKNQLRLRFSKFGTITAITLHFIENGYNYGFVTFKNCNEAYKAIKHGNDDTSLPDYDLCFRGAQTYKFPFERYGQQSRSPSYKTSSSLKRKYEEDDHVKQMEGYRVIRIGHIADGTTRTQLRDRFNKFGTITDISVHFRDHGDNYCFVTFQNCDEAYKAIKHGDNDTFLPHYDLCSRAGLASKFPFRRNGQQFMSPLHRKSRSLRMKYEEDYNVKQMKEHRVICISHIVEGTTKTQLRDRFTKYGTITNISVHFGNHGDNYGFVTFRNCDEAYKAIEHGNDDTSLYYCKFPYHDLDAHVDNSDWGTLKCDGSGSSVSSGGGASSTDFSALLKAAMENKQNENITFGSRIFDDTVFDK